MAGEKLGIGRDRGPDQDPNPNVRSRPVQGQDHKIQARDSVSCHVMSEYNGSFLSTMMSIFPEKRDPVYCRSDSITTRPSHLLILS